MKTKQLLEGALRRVLAQKGWEWPEKAVLEPPRDKRFGDLSANLALILAGQAGKRPLDVAQDIKDGLARDPDIQRVDIAGPGFLNFTFSPGFWRRVALDVLAQGPEYGASDLGRGQRAQVEFVSANPTGPLHIGHGRGAALGDSLARILRKAGFEVQTEYYINDAGRQMRLLGESIWYRLEQLAGRTPAEPADYYKGEYVRDLAAEMLAADPDLAARPADQALAACREYGMSAILKGIKKDLADFRVGHEVWFSEKGLVESGRVEQTFAWLKDKGLAFEADGALWFKSAMFGDDKDRVLRKSSGELTYFASDIAYHDDKFRRGFDLVVDIWGADHHGYAPRLQAAVEAMGAKGRLQIQLVQLVNLLRDGEQVAMSTRAGQFETLADVVAEVGVDASRFIFLSRKSDSHLDFDLELVKRQSMDNPVYYVQYAHARICSVLRKAGERGITPARPSELALAALDTAEDMDLLRLLDQYPDSLEAAARTLSPHLISFYLQDLASVLHKYYTVHHVLSAGPDLCRARLLLLQGVAQVLKNGLELLGVSAPEQMESIN
ncbi:MAG: arginine--tRNA ligase [Desulfovibrionaceae bacterium]|nr:arginine--tRNA ligase [Desulfovibrionaceae bacterium]